MTPQMILEVGAEGGSIALFGHEDETSNWEFWTSTDDSSFYMLSEEDQEGLSPSTTSTKVNALSAALKQLDRYPWHKLHPISLHSEFNQQVLSEVYARGGKVCVDNWLQTLGITDFVAAAQSDLEAQVQFDFAVKELHIDFLLQEEFSSDPEFLRRFLLDAAHNLDQNSKQTGLAVYSEKSPEALRKISAGKLNIKRVGHSIVDQHGEADLIVLFTQANNPNHRIALLIEDKIRAQFQDRQAKRYRDRGESGLEAGEWGEFWTILVAPADYIERGHGFEATVTLQQITESLSLAEGARRNFKIRVIDDAVKTPATGVKVVDPVMTQFRKDHFTYLDEFFQHRRSHFVIRNPTPTYSGDWWFTFKSPEFLPKNAYINHKAYSGFVDLTFPNTNAELLLPLAAILETGMTIHQTGKSSAIRLIVPSIPSFSNFAEQRDRIAVALAAVTRLLDFYVAKRQGIDSFLKTAKTT